MYKGLQCEFCGMDYEDTPEDIRIHKSTHTQLCRSARIASHLATYGVKKFWSIADDPSISAMLGLGEMGIPEKVKSDSGFLIVHRNCYTDYKPNAMMEQLVTEKFAEKRYDRVMYYVLTQRGMEAVAAYIGRDIIYFS